MREAKPNTLREHYLERARSWLGSTAQQDGCAIDPDAARASLLLAIALADRRRIDLQADHGLALSTARRCEEASDRLGNEIERLLDVLGTIEPPFPGEQA